MPDVFGNETPQEAIQRVRGRFQENNQRFQNSAAFSSPGAQAGQALANIFGPTTQRFLDTRAARKSEAERLVETGLSVQEAREAAKQNVSFDFREVRQAKQFREFAKDADQRVVDLTSEGQSPALAQSGGMLVMASKLRAAGFAQEATSMTQQAGEIRTAELQRLAELDNLNARTEASRTSTLKSINDIANSDDTDFTRLTDASEVLASRIEVSDDPREVAALSRKKGNIDAQIVKRNMITGTTEFDPSNLSTAGRNKQATEIIEGRVLDDSLAALEDTLINIKGDLAAGVLGTMGEGALGFAEKWLNRTPTESEEDFLERVRSTKAEPALIAADIRHSLTGAAMSPAEAVFLEPFLPTPGDARTTMLNKVRVIRKYTQLDIATRQALLNDEVNGVKFMATLKTAAVSEVKAQKEGPTEEASLSTGEALDNDVANAIAILEGNN